MGESEVRADIAYSNRLNWGLKCCEMSSQEVWTGQEVWSSQQIWKCQEVWSSQEIWTGKQIWTGQQIRTSQDWYLTTKSNSGAGLYHHIPGEVNNVCQKWIQFNSMNKTRSLNGSEVWTKFFCSKSLRMVQFAKLTG